MIYALNVEAETLSPVAVANEFLSRRREMYSGGSVEAVAALIVEDRLRHVPGRSPIAGDYRGSDAALDHFETRQRLAGGPMSITNGAQP